MNSTRPAFLALLSATGAALVLLQQSGHGVVLDWDSVNYIGTARNLASGNGFARFDGSPYETFPPLYPAMLAVASLFVFDPLAVAGPLNAVLFGATIFVTGRWMRERLESPALGLVGCLAVAFSAPGIWMATWAMTETAFVLLTTLCLIKTDESIRAADQARSRRCLMWAAVFCALACLCRFAGVALVPVVTAMVASRRDVAPSERLKRSASFVVVSCLPVCAWLVRNQVVTSTWVGKRDYRYTSPADTRTLTDRRTLADVLGQVADLVRGVESYIGWWPVLLGLGLVAGVLAAASLGLAAPGRRTACRRRRRAAAASIALCGAYGLAQLVLLIPSVLWRFVHELIARYFVPVHMSFLLAALVALDLTASSRRHRARFVAPIACIVLLLPQVALLVPITSVALSGVNHGYAGPRWTNSEALRWVREHALSGTLVSNDAAATYIHLTTPSGHRYMPCDRSAWREFLADLDGDAHILFFPSQAKNRNDYCAPHGYDLADLLALPGARTVAELADGTVLKVGSPGEGQFQR